MKNQFNHVKITGVSAVVPDNCINIDDELCFFDNDIKKLERNKKILGLGTRYVVDDRTSNSDLCEAAAEDLLNTLSIDREEIDALIVASSSHDYHYPASACILQERLGLSEECTAFDISGLACSAYVHGLFLAHSMIASGASKKCLVLAGDIVSRHSDRRNRNSNMLFGDAGTATLLEYSEQENTAWFYTGTRGSGWDKLIAPAGGYALPIKEDIIHIEETDFAGNVWHLWEDIMKGMDIFKFTNEIAPRGIAEILKFSNKSMEDINYFAFHQANKQIVRSIAMHANIPSDKFSTQAFSTYGNCSTASVTTDICHNLKDKPRELVCLATFGVGLSWGFSVLNLQDTYIGGIQLYKTPAEKMTREEKIKYWISHFKENENVKG